MRSFREICENLRHGMQARLPCSIEPGDLQIMEWELARWLGSQARERMLTGEAYFVGEHDILQRERTVIGRGGQQEAVRNLPNNRLVNNQYGKLVNQKADYLLGQPISWEVENPGFDAVLKRIFDRRFMRQLKRLGKTCYNEGVAWLYPYIDAEGALRFRSFPGHEILPFWADAEHSRLECALRFYQLEGWVNGTLSLIDMVEIFDLAGVHCFRYEQGKLLPEDDCHHAYLIHKLPDGSFERVNWSRVPLVPFKLNAREQPLLLRVKGLQDALNQALSQFQNALEEDAHNTILVIKNYDGTDLDEFRHNLAAYGAVKVKTVDGAGGGIDTLSVNVDAANFEAVIKLLKDAIIENGMGFDAKLEKGYRAANELNIKSMYSDITLDANDFEAELQAAFEDLLWFVKAYLFNTGQGDYMSESWRLIFNRDIMVDESEVIENCVKSQGLLSTAAIVAQHPWVNDVSGELARLKAEQSEQAQIAAGGE